MKTKINCKEQNKEKEKKESIYFFRGARAETSQLNIYLYIRLIQFINK